MGKLEVVGAGGGCVVGVEVKEAHVLAVEVKLGRTHRTVTVFLH